MSRKPRLLDLFCKAGGASTGYDWAGFEVIGVDIEAQPHYPFRFIQADALTIALEGYDAYAASPPCQLHSVTHRLWADREHPDLIAAIRERLVATGKPYIIENVVGAPLIDPVQICGSGLGLRMRRHRLFESNVALRGVACQHGWQRADPIFPQHWGHAGRKGMTGVVTVFGNGGSSEISDAGGTAPERVRREVMEIDWMSRPELSEAIPPRYTRFLGRQLIRSC